MAKYQNHSASIAFDDETALAVDSHTETVWFKTSRYSRNRIVREGGQNNLMIPSNETMHFLPAVVNVNINDRVIVFTRGLIDMHNQFGNYASADAEFPKMTIFSTR